MSPYLRRALSGAVLAAALLSLTACSQGSATNGGADDAASGTATVTYMNFSANGGHEKDLQAIADAFHEENPDIIVKIETVPYDSYFTKLQTAVAGDTAGDAFELNYENFVTYAANGSLAELKNIDTGDYRASLVEAFNVDGKQYGLPESFSNVVLFYNKDLFRAKGVAEPTADWTWADEQKAAEALTDAATGTWGDYQPITFHEFYKALAQAGGKFMVEDGTKTAFNSAEGVNAATWLIGKSGKTMPTEADGAGTPDFDSKQFQEGKLAMWHSGIWMFDALKDAEFDWDIVVEPGDSTKASAMFTNGAVVNAKSANVDAATRWVAYLTASKAMSEIRLASSWELPPVSDDAVFDSYLGKGKPDNRRAVLDSLDKTVLPPVIESQQEMQDILTQELTAAAAKRKTVEEALADAARAVDALTEQ
ncbi:MAG: sugar ABC transporter substrate-binding protein [Schaalia hyovaginalis]|uniref:ABC transporter substrate-binding protein n=1 Tax=Schaalia hyovaginalis TaxID=29316 RepID=UPI002A914C59|nr:sugar ABC transporter substrate-binding protein [Schaalia hyovaginalis]MDY6213546.1 sugar ABC transporter substrate-binding protein [Schaalia hyovaginalis]